MARTAQAAQWLAAIARPPVRAGLERIYKRAADAIIARAPVCWASGRCCNFAQAGHRLYVTGLEAAYLVSALPTAERRAFEPPTAEPASAEPAPAGPPSGARSVTLQQALAPLHVHDVNSTREWLGQSGPAPNCLFQRANLCSVHTIKPLACRLYFCDRTAQSWQNETLEILIADLRALHDEESIPYHYAEWRAMLAMFAQS